MRDRSFYGKNVCANMHIRLYNEHVLYALRKKTVKSENKVG